MKKFLLSLAFGLLLSGSPLRAQVDATCVAPQWKYATYQSGGVTYYSYYSALCEDGEMYPTWVSYDTTEDHGDYPNSDCLYNSNGVIEACSEPAYPHLTSRDPSQTSKQEYARKNEKGKSEKDEKLKPIPATKDGRGRPTPGSLLKNYLVHGVEKTRTMPPHTGLGQSGLNPAGGPWSGNLMPTLDTNGGVDLSSTAFVKVNLPTGSGNHIFARLFRFTLNPFDNPGPGASGATWPPNGARVIILGSGYQVKPSDVPMSPVPDEIPASSVEKVSYFPGGTPSPNTRCIRFEYKGVTYQVITHRMVQ